MSGREPSAAFEQEEPVWCDLHQRRDCTLCDECGHELHAWAPALEAAGHAKAAAYVYHEATCWAENICATCDPQAYAIALQLAEPVA
jgi:hypothetical protein